MKTISHNKLGNSALIFEILSQKFTKAALDGNKKVAKTVLYLVQKYYNTTSILNEELNLITSLLHGNISDTNTATRLLNEVLNRTFMLDSKKLKNIKFKLLTEIKSLFGNKFFKHKIDNYKQYASVYSLIESNRKNTLDSNVEQKVKLEESVINNLIENTDRKNESKNVKVKKIDPLVYVMLVKGFNEKYKQSLNENQKQLLNEYITNDNFDNFVNSYYKKIQNSLYEAINKSKEKDTSANIFESMQKLDKIHEYDNDKKLELLLTYSQLIEELNKKLNE